MMKRFGQWRATDVYIEPTEFKKSRFLHFAAILLGVAAVLAYAYAEFTAYASIGGADVVTVGQSSHFSFLFLRSVALASLAALCEIMSLAQMAMTRLTIFRRAAAVAAPAAAVGDSAPRDPVVAPT